MDSPLLKLPRELRDMISSNVISASQPFHIKSISTSGLATSNPQPGLLLTCKKLRSEAAQATRSTAFTSGTKITATVHNFDFTALIAFVRTLRPHEIAAANRYENFVVIFIACNVASASAQQRIAEWVRFCELWGVEMEYQVMQWASVSVSELKCLESNIGGKREGTKIVRILAGMNVKSWSWADWQRGLEAERRQRIV